jgi:hypothetical protein
LVFKQALFAMRRSLVWSANKASFFNDYKGADFQYIIDAFSKASSYLEYIQILRQIYAFLGGL